MKISYNWLKEYVNSKLKEDELLERLIMAGFEIESAQKLGNDFIFEIEITSNRPDCLSLIGMAREVAAITSSKVKLPKIAPGSKLQAPGKSSSVQPGVISIIDKIGCPIYTAKIIKNVKVQDSPAWLKDKLTCVGLRPVNNVVDITNFVLFETGQPLHAFDLDRLSDSKIIVRRAGENELIKTIDAKERKLNKEILVIADAKKPVAIAGIMGGLESEVGSGTKNILLESAYFNPIRIRRGSRLLGISTDSSYRFERAVDINTVFSASDRATQLIIDIAGGELADDICASSYKKSKAKKKILLDVQELNSILNIDINSAKIKKILNALGFSVTGSSNKLSVTVPDFRQDVQIKEDLFEEVARIYGFDRIKSTLPKIIPSQEESEPLKLRVEKKARRVLTAQGLDEAITYSLLNAKILQNANIPTDNLRKIANPLNPDQAILRPTQLPGLVLSAAYNINRQQPSVRLFEIGNSFSKDTEKLTLGIIITGEDFSVCLPKTKANLDLNIYSLKGIIENLFLSLGVKSFKFSCKDFDFFDPAASSAIIVGDKEVGFLGRVSSEVLSNFSVKTQKEILFAHIELENLITSVDFNKTFTPINQYPYITRDISLVADSSITFERMDELIRKSGSGIVTEVKIKDYYKGEPIPKDKAGLTLSIKFQSSERTLNDEEVNNLRDNICKALADELKVTIR